MLTDQYSHQANNLPSLAHDFKVLWKNIMSKDHQVGNCEVY